MEPPNKDVSFKNTITTWKKNKSNFLTRLTTEVASKSNV